MSVASTNILFGLAGGALIGLGAALLLGVNGRLAGVSSIVAGLLEPRRVESWRIAFVLGLVLVGFVVAKFEPARIPASQASLGVLAVSGLLVGIGTRIGSGCTSGHGVCGLGRFSVRSLVATMVFMLVGMLTVSVVGAP